MCQISPMYKQGSSEILSIWLFFSWIIILIVIVATVTLFYSKTVDIRQVESEVLLKRISDCVFPQNQLVYFKPTETKFGQKNFQLKITDKQTPDITETTGETMRDESDLTGLEPADLSTGMLNAVGSSSDNIGKNLPDLFQACLLREGILNTNSYFLAISIYEKENYINNVLLKIDADKSKATPVNVIKTGNPDLEIQCELKGKNFANCEKKMFIVADHSGLEFFVEIIAASNKYQKISLGVKNEG